jgi:hypothetical protein
MSDLERLARAALADELKHSPRRDFETAWDEEGDIWISNTRAILTELRDVRSEGMRLAMWDSADELGAAIDHILSEPTPDAPEELR